MFPSLSRSRADLPQGCGFGPWTTSARASIARRRAASRSFTGEAGRWEVVLSTKYTNMTDDQQRTHHWGFYRLAIDGLPFHPDCFNVTRGQTTTEPGETSEALVGFDLSVAPTNDATLLLDVWND